MHPPALHLALSSTHTLTPVEQVKLAKAYKVPHWLEDGYHDLVRRIPSITPDDARSLGIETTVALYQIREQIAARTGTSGLTPRTAITGSGANATSGREDQDFADLVRGCSVGNFRKSRRQVGCTYRLITHYQPCSI